MAYMAVIIYDGGEPPILVSFNCSTDLYYKSKQVSIAHSCRGSNFPISAGDPLQWVGADPTWVLGGLESPHPAGSPLIEWEMKGEEEGENKEKEGLKKGEGDESPLQSGFGSAPVYEGGGGESSHPRVSGDRAPQNSGDGGGDRN